MIDYNEQYVMEQMLEDNPTLAPTRLKKGKKARRARAASTRRNIRMGVVRELDRISDFIEAHPEYSFALMIAYFKLKYSKDNI
jgi:hypothetical protein